MYRLENVFVLCTVQFSDAKRCDISLSNLIPRSIARVFVLIMLFHCDFSVRKSVTFPVETCNRSSFPYESGQN
jgi:hypothetical protein